MTKERDIKTMKLYHHLDRIERRLQGGNGQTAVLSKSVNAAEPSPLDPELLGAIDALHFFDDEPVQRVARLVQRAQDSGKAGDGDADADVAVLDIGTGYGGTARLLAHRTRCRVDALELQPDLSDFGRELTRRCALQDHVTHLTGDFLKLPVHTQSYDVLVGLLSFLHIGNWHELFARCFHSLKPGGVLYVEDFFQRGAAFSSDEKRVLRDDIYCSELCTRAELLTLLHTSGFEVVSLDDVSDKWVPYVVRRAETFAADLDKHAAVDGLAAAVALKHFYSSVASVFAHGNLGGYMLVARRPATASSSAPVLRDPEEP